MIVTLFAGTPEQANVQVILPRGWKLLNQDIFYGQPPNIATLEFASEEGCPVLCVGLKFDPEAGIVIYPGYTTSGARAETELNPPRLTLDPLPLVVADQTISLQLVQ